MKDGFIKVAAATVEISVADVKNNVTKIREQITDADKSGVNLLVLPELCVTGCTCGDLLYSDMLLQESLSALGELCAFTSEKYPIVAVSLPLLIDTKVYNSTAILHRGKILGIAPKGYIDTCELHICGQTVAVASDIVFKCSALPQFTFGTAATMAAIVADCAADAEIVGASDYRRQLICADSAEHICGYVYAGADYSESTQNMVFARHLMIAENGKMLAENKPFGNNSMIISEIDVKRLSLERARDEGFIERDGEITVIFEQEIKNTKLTRNIKKAPFIPDDETTLCERAEAILNIQSYGLRKRLLHTGAKCAVLGISGGLDSTLALLVAVRTMKLLARPLSDIRAFTMPCFGTTDRTKSNAQRLCELLGVRIDEINITNSVISHFEDIAQKRDCFDVTFENSQARERTQVLMDKANQLGGLVIGTGDLSELALGWATYNGDHMSMYGVNADVPKTLVRHLVRCEAENYGGELKTVLLDILDTPVSPELLPTDQNGQMKQKTEDLVGPYELHDFFLYHTVRYGAGPKKIFRLAKAAFGKEYDDETIINWLRVFTRRFFAQQFKRSCLPDGAKIGTVSLSPRGDFDMPSDASVKLWLNEIDSIK